MATPPTAARQVMTPEGKLIWEIGADADPASPGGQGTSANYFDKYDEKPGNYFDKYDAPPSRVQGTGVGAIDQTTSSVNEALLGIPVGLMNMGSAVTDTVLKPFVGDAAVKAAQQQRKGAFDAVSRAISPREAGGARMVGEIASTIPFAGVKVAGAAPWINRGIQGLIGGAGVRDSGEGPGWNPGIGAALNIALPPVVGKVANYIGTSRPGQWLGQNILKGTNAALDATGAKTAFKTVLDAADDAAGKVYDEVGGMFGGKARPRVDPEILARSRAPALPDVAPVAPIAPNAGPAMPGMPNVGAPAGAAAAAPAAPQQPQIVEQVFGPEAQARLNNFRSIGVENPTTGMVTRDPRTWTYEQNTAKLEGIGDTLLGSFQKVNDDLETAVERLLTQRGGTVDPEAVGRQVSDVLATKSKEMQTVVGTLYKNVRNNRGDVSTGSLPNFRAMLEDADLLDNSKFDVIRNDVMRRLQRFGMAGQSGLLRNDAVATISQAEELRKFIRTTGDAKDPDVQRMHKMLIDALDDDVIATHGDDAFKAARAAAKARFDEFNKTFVGKLSNNGIFDEQVVSRIFQKGVSNADVRALKQSFYTGTPEQVARGVAAWQGIGQQALDDMFKKSRLNDGTLSPSQLSKRFEEMSPKLREMLTPEEFQTVQSIVDAVEHSTAKVPFSAVNYSGTMPGIANLFADATGRPSTGGRFLSNIAQHLGANLLAGPGGNIALAATKQATASTAAEIAADRALKASLAKVNLAKSPEAAAAALRDLQSRAARDAAFASAIKRWQDGGFYSFLNKSNAGP